MISHIHLPDMTWLVTSVRLETATEFCMKVGKTGATPNETNNSAPVERRITNFHMGIYADLIATPDMTSSSTLNRHLSKFKKKRRKMPSWTVWDEFLWCSVLPAPPIGGFLVMINNCFKHGVSYFTAIDL